MATEIVHNTTLSIDGSGCLMDTVSASQARDRGFELQTDPSYETSNGWFYNDLNKFRIELK